MISGKGYHTLADCRGSDSPANAATSEQSEVPSMRCPLNEAPHKSPFNPPRNPPSSQTNLHPIALDAPAGGLEHGAASGHPGARRAAEMAHATPRETPCIAA